MKIKEIFDIEEGVTFINELVDYLEEKRNSSTGVQKAKD